MTGVCHRIKRLVCDVQLNADRCLIYMFTFLLKYQCYSVVLNLPFFHML